MPIPKNIREEHIAQAIGDIDKNGYDSKFESRDYVLCFQDKFYPPKYVIRLANKFANGRELESSDFISHDANRVLTKLGFTVTRTSLTGSRGQTEINPSPPTEPPPGSAPFETDQPQRSDADLVIALSNSVETILEQLELRGPNRDVASWINDLEGKDYIPKQISFRMHSIRMTRNRVIHKSYVLSPTERIALNADWATIEEWWRNKRKG